MTRGAAALVASPPTPLRTFLAPAVVFALALALRIGFVLEIRGTPVFQSPNMDAAYYDRMAQGYAAGDWLPDRAFWYAPLYPYFIGVLYAFFGRSLLAIGLVQAVLGAINALLVLGIGSRLFGRRVGVVAGAVAAIYPLFIFYEAFPSKDTFSALLLDLALYLLLVARDRGSLAVVGASGASLGAAILSRGNFLLHLPLFSIAAFVLLRREPGLRRAIAAAAVLSVSTLAAMAPATIVNAAVSRDFVLVSYNGGPVLYTGNCPFNRTGSQIVVSDYFPTLDSKRRWNEHEEEFFVREAERARGRGLKPSEVSSHWSGLALEWAAGHPRDFLRLLWAKIALYFNWYEVPNNDDYYFVRHEYSSLLKLPLPTFGWVCPIGLVGLVLAFRRPRGGFLAPAVFLIDAASVILFFVVSRYRITAVPMLMLGAALAIVMAVDAIRSRRYLKLALLASAAAGLALFVNRNLGGERPTISEGYRLLALKLRAAGDAKGAERAVDRALDEDPKSFEAMRLKAYLSSDAGEFERAASETEQSIRLAPGAFGARESIVLLATLRLRLGNEKEALRLFDEALRIQADDPEVLNATAWLLAFARDPAVRNPDRAVRLAQRAVDFEPSNERYQDTLKLAREEAARPR